MDNYKVTFRCDLCQRVVDDDTRVRARRVWKPLIICDGCVREAGTQQATERPSYAAAAG